MRTGRGRLGLLVTVGLLGIASLAPPAGAVYRSAPLDLQGSGVLYSQGATTRPSAHANASDGSLGVWTRSNYYGDPCCAPGGSVAYAALGILYPVNSGPTLTAPYQALATVDPVMTYWFNCRSGSQARVDVWATVDRWDGTGWVNESELGRAGATCPDEGGGGGGSVPGFARWNTFAPGTYYRIVLWTLSQAFSSSGDLVHSGADGNAGGFEVYNQAPVAAFPGAQASYLSNLIAGTPISGDVCDYDGYLTSASISAGLLAVPSSASWNAGGRTDVACVRGGYSPRYLVPGSHSGSMSGNDNEGSGGSASGTVTVSLFGMAAGLPDLEAISEDRLGRVVEVEALLRDDGSVRGAAVRSAGRILAETLRGVSRSGGDHRGIVRLDRAARTASVSLDGVEVWSGAVTRVGRDWWEIAPASEPGAREIARAGAAIERLGIVGPTAYRFSTTERLEPPAAALAEVAP